MAFLQADNLVKDFKSGSKILRVLKGVSLEVGEGEIVAVLGPSGSGKSTLLHLLGFMDRPTAGDVIFRERSLAVVDHVEQSRLRNRHFGFVFQMYHLLPELSAFENALLPLMIRHGAAAWLRVGREHKERVRALMESVGLGERLHHRPHQLSGGERQRVALARALAGDPEIVFCDEPTGNLDAATSREIQELILRLSEETGKAFVLVTHDATVARLARRQLNLVDGQLQS